MNDRHLNLFYSYNRDNELIENNLTRALIVSLSFISNQTRDRLLNELLCKPLSRLGIDPIPSFHDVNFALQGNMDKQIIWNCENRYVVIIATDRVLDINELNSQDEQVEFATEAYERSIPDGWIYNSSLGYCFLLEVKVGTYPVNPDQIYSHAIGWLKIPRDEVQNHAISLTWYDMLEAIEQVEGDAANQLEKSILINLKQFIGFFDYRLFQGFEFRDLHFPPEYYLLPELSYLSFDLTELSDPPEFRLNLSYG